jgi:hypothetical protein
VLRPVGGEEESLEWLLYEGCFYVYRPDRPDLGFVGFISQSDYDITVRERGSGFEVAAKEGPDGQV